MHRDRSLRSRDGHKRRIQTIDEGFYGSMTWDEWIKDVPGDLHPRHIKQVGPVNPWSDPKYRERWPWSAIIWYVDDVLVSIGEPFVKVVHTGPQSWSIGTVWRRHAQPRYQTSAPSNETLIARGAKRGDLLSQPAFRKLPPGIGDWVLDVQEKAVTVARLVADVEGCIHYLQNQTKARHDLIDALARTVVPAPSKEMKKAITQDSQRALAQIRRALRKAQAAKKMLEPCTNYFLNKKSPTLRKDRDRLLTLLVRHGEVTRNRASGLVAELLPTINPNFTARRGSIRVSAYPPSTPST